MEYVSGPRLTEALFLFFSQRVTLTGKPKLLIDAKDVDTNKMFQY